MHSVVFHRPKRANLFMALLGAATLLVVFAGCGGGGGGGNTNTPVNGKGCNKVGVLLPETASSPRWEGKDHPELKRALTAAGFTVSDADFQNANGSDDTQLSQAEADLTKGYCILIVAPHDSGKAAAIVAKAKEQKVPVIAYDRFIFSDDLNYYASFDGVKVGNLQGQYIADHYKDAQYGVSAGHNNIAFLNGSDTDNNAHLFAQGAHEVLDPLISNGTLKKVYEQFTPDWDGAKGQQEMEAALTSNNNNIQLVLAANDTLGNAAVQALPAGQVGKVLITGQDATVQGIQNILEGKQGMTVYKPIPKLADAAAAIAKALRDGQDVSKLDHYSTLKNPKGNANVPSVLETPISVDKSNVASTVIADGYVTKDEVCKDIPAGTDTGGVCS